MKLSRSNPKGKSGHEESSISVQKLEGSMIFGTTNTNRTSSREGIERLYLSELSKNTMKLERLLLSWRLELTRYYSTTNSTP